MNRKYPILLMSVMLSACCSQEVRTQYMEKFPETDCSAGLRRKLSISAEVLPIDMPAQFLPNNALATHGMLARRILVSSIPNGLDRRYRITEGKLSLRSLGGTFIAAVKLETGHLSLDASQSSSSRALRGDDGVESVAIETTPGQITITRDEKAGDSALQTIVIDLVVLAGDKPFDDNILRVRALWSAPQRPLAPDTLNLQLVPFRHTSADEVDAIIDFTYALRGGSSEVICSTSTTTTLVNKEATRQPLWDIGVVAPTGRKKWLALYSPKTGVFRPVFDAPVDANSFMRWIQASGASTVGDFSLGITDGYSTNASTQSANNTSALSFRPIAPDEVSALGVGSIGEP